MLRITITQFAYQPAVQQFVGAVTGVIDADERGARVVHGGEGWLLVRVPDVETGGSIGADDDPVRWATLLPDFLSGGDTEVSVHEVAARSVAPALPSMAKPAVEALAAAVHPV